MSQHATKTITTTKILPEKMTERKKKANENDKNHKRIRITREKSYSVQWLTRKIEGGWLAEFVALFCYLNKLQWQTFRVHSDKCVEKIQGIQQNRRNKTT